MILIEVNREIIRLYEGDSRRMIEALEKAVRQREHTSQGESRGKAQQSERGC